MYITETMTLEEIYHHHHLFNVKDYLIGNGANFYEERKSLSLEQIQKQIPAYNPKDICYGLNRLIDLMNTLLVFIQSMDLSIPHFFDLVNKHITNRLFV